ncbi:hypothetical protein OQJ19_02170 [Fluoribacter gormanii]|uniref:Uncharacterized protein n=1 Tax=Fluoribacter gormanii TaxID=464 RepID=A0A377GIK9_9GAMM|nr:hypothetical protein [Fluoribacter gormanii]KTD03260.1 hypothetical protein Lgor_1245 [Fluoribacter gormanii]MCW8444267.1 hypothetical protein [Fluoribacter gormanii]MCW8469460.1 hypothetical protein [Fluoribacter gormanii]SIR72089.1 hypothetical protein SAMN05421777_12127 [Fluoribacter gormanii]STO24212.1 Uncharacterised protein [Fluoribacter gormanii]
MMSRFFSGVVKPAFETTGYTIAAAVVGSTIHTLTTMNDKTKEEKPESLDAEQDNSSSNVKMSF